MDLSARTAAFGHLSYCSNIHAGESWDEVLENLRAHIPAIKAKLSPDDSFGIGLRLSADAATELAKPSAIADLRDFLVEHDCYVFTINGFPYGTFHGEPVKESVYLPDWKDPARLDYSNTIADVFAQILPPQITGSISTVPGAFKASVQSTDDIAQMTHYFVEQAAYLVDIERRTGKHMVLALTLCLDLCHAAVEFENCDDCLDALDAAGIPIGKVQISAGLRIPNISSKNKSMLTPFIDQVYLHQVVEQYQDQLNRYPDLPDALEALGDSYEEREWRVHFHVPIFLDDLGEFSSTQFFIEQALKRHAVKPISQHLEVETYTWDVLPESYRAQSVDDAIVRELTWVIDALNANAVKKAA